MQWYYFKIHQKQRKTQIIWKSMVNTFFSFAWFSLTEPLNISKDLNHKSRYLSLYLELIWVVEYLHCNLHIWLRGYVVGHWWKHLLWHPSLNHVAYMQWWILWFMGLESYILSTDFGNSMQNLGKKIATALTSPFFKQSWTHPFLNSLDPPLLILRFLSSKCYWMAV